MVDEVAALGICSHTLLTVPLQVAGPKTVNRVIRMKVTFSVMNDCYTVQV